MLKPRIMIVEDERIESLALQDSLARLGYCVSAVAASGAEAVRLAEETVPDLVLMDIKISGAMDGIEAAKAIQAARDIPVIYLSGLSDQDTLRRALVSSPFGYLVKPFDEGELRTTVEIALYKHRMQRELKMAKEAATSAKHDFLSRMTHEPRTPLSGILGLAGTVPASGLPPDQRVQVERIKRSARSLISTLGDTLAAFRSGETGDVEFSLRAGLDSVLEPLAVQAQSKGLRLAWSVGPDVPDRLRGDEDTLLQAVRNVVVHAVRAAVHGAVEVRVGSPAASSPDGVTLRFEIRSPAPGFPDNEPHPGHKGLGLPRAGALVHALGSTLLMTPGPDGSVSFSLRLQHA